MQISLFTSPCRPEKKTPHIYLPQIVITFEAVQLATQRINLFHFLFTFYAVGFFFFFVGQVGVAEVQHATKLKFAG